MTIKFISKESKYRERLDRYLSGSRSRNTKIAYKNDLEIFWASVGKSECYPVSEELIVSFITEQLKSKSISTIQRRVSTLSFAHELLELKNPCRSRKVQQLLSKARKERANEPRAKQEKSPITLNILDSILGNCDDSLIDLRDKALLLFSFASGGRKRSEISSASMRGLTKTRDGYTFKIFSVRTVQSGISREVPILGFAAEALEKWLFRASIKDGYIFRQVTKGGRITDKGVSDKLVDRVVKKRVQMAGLNPAKYSAQSLRLGFIVEADRLKLPAEDVRALTGITSTVTMRESLISRNPQHNKAALITDGLMSPKRLLK